MTPSFEQFDALFSSLAEHRRAQCPFDGAEMRCERVSRRTSMDMRAPFWHCVCPTCGLELKLHRKDDPRFRMFRPYTVAEIGALVLNFRKNGVEGRCPVDMTVLRSSRNRLKPSVTRLLCVRCGQITEVPDEEGAGKAAVITKVPMAEDLLAEVEARIEPPSGERVARRACAMAAVSARALFENEDPEDPNFEKTRREILEWVRGVSIEEELEPDEAKLLHLPLGVPPRQDIINGTWLIEGVGILAWALGRYDMPAYDELFDPGELLPALGILSMDRAQAFLADPVLRSREILDRLSWQLFTIHWRLENFLQEPKAINFRDLPKTSCFSQLLDVSGCRFIDGDLAIGDQRIDRAPREKVASCMSAAQERHRAINWLSGDADRYSETDTTT